MKLTPSQKKAVEIRGKHVLVSAGAGTGKTRVLVERVVSLIASQTVTVPEILVLTFTEKAAGEIKQRISARLREEKLLRARQDLESAAVSTFHGFAARFLRTHPVEAGVDPEFRVLENEEAELLQEEALDDTVSSFFERQSPVFKIFEIYGETPVRESILTVYHAACQEGLNLEEYFKKWEAFRSEKMKTMKAGLAEAAEEKIKPIAAHMEAKIWREWVRKGISGWDDDLSFQSWFQEHRRAPQKEVQSAWKEWKEFVEEEWLPFQYDLLLREPRELFERAAVEFEAIYAQKKRLQNGLDFDDLQIQAARLLRQSDPGSQIAANALKRQFRFVFVDEFQDTSHLQMELVRVLMPGAEVFLVGDYKQSIYAFRGAEPRLFLETRSEFQNSEKAITLELADNFRSGPEVLQFTNTFFERLWEDSEIPFSKLIAAKKEEDAEDALELKTELIAVTADEDGDTAENRLREGARIAARMSQLHAEGVPYGHMAVLFSAMTHSALYEYALRRAGIPYLSVSGTSFYDQPEIRDLISLLECLQNPLADIALAAVLRSPFVRVTDETLFWLAEKAKRENEKTPLFEGLQKFRSISEISDSEKEKLALFENQFQIWRSRKDAGKLSDLIENAVQQTGYAVWALAQAAGVRRYGHVRKFIQLARRQESRGRLSIHRFLALVRRLRFQDVRESESISSTEEVQAVRLMTVHAAKGLEFPYVFVADLGRKKTSQERQQPVLAFPNAGWALKIKNPLTGKNEMPWSYKQIASLQDGQNREEYQRLFYVAATRAEKKLILSGVWKPLKKEKTSYAEMNSWIEWVMQSKDLTAEAPAPESPKVPEKTTLPGSLSERPHFKAWLKAAEKGEPFPSFAEHVSDAALAAAARVQTVYQPEFSKAIDLPVSAYVLFLKSPEKFWSAYGQGWSLPGAEWGEAAVSDPAARFEDAADFGTRMHRALEFIDWARPKESLTAKSMDVFFAGVSETKKKEAEEILAGFFETPLFAELKSSRQVCRELEFVLNARRGLIEGVIDVLFENGDGSFTVLDYKTAEGDEQKAVESGYDLQIQIYALAAAKILNRPVTRAQIYFLKNRKTVSVALPDFAKIENDVNELQLRLLDFVRSKWSYA